MRNPPSQLMVFAAGFGTRMNPLTLTTPKPLLRVGQTTLLDHTLGLANAAGITRKVVNAHYHADQIQQHLAQSDVQVVVEDPILDTGGGLKNACAMFDDTHVITSNSDAVWSGPNPFQELAQSWHPDCDALFLCVPLDRAMGRIPPGDFDQSPQGILQRGTSLVYTGIHIIRLDLITQYPDTVFSLNKVWDPLLAAGRAHCALYPGIWCDVGRPENLETATNLLERPDV